MGFLSDLEDKISDKESKVGISLEDVEFTLPISGKKIRLSGNLKLNNLKIGFGRKKKK